MTARYTSDFISKRLPPPIHKGTIVWAMVRLQNGIPKRRRCIVLAEPEDKPGELVHLIGVCSDDGDYNPTNVQHYPPDEFYPVPFSLDGSCPTTFHRPSAAYAGFYLRKPIGELESNGGLLGEGGRVPQKLVDEILTRLRAWIRRKMKEETERADRAKK